MLQALLIDRLSLRIHYTTIEGSIYLLSKGKGSLKLEPPKDMNRTPAFVLSMAGTTFDGEARAATASMKDVAETLSSDLDTPVEDKTGLSGRYDFYVEPFAPENDSVEVAAVGAMHRLGLELRKTKAPVKVMVIDSIQSPSPN